MVIDLITIDFSFSYFSHLDKNYSIHEMTHIISQFKSIRIDRETPFMLCFENLMAICVYEMDL